MSDQASPKRLAFFERYLTVWVFLCMVVGVALGKFAPQFTADLRKFEFGQGSHVNVPIAVLIWLMIYPMMLKVDFGAIGGVAKRPKGLAVTLFINWLVKPFSMAFLGWLFMSHVFSAWISPELANEYTAGLIILAAAPCTAMVFVWSYLTDGDPAYTLVQVAVNDLIMLVAFAPIVMFLCGVANVVVPPKVLITSVVVFIVIPLAAGWLTRTALLKLHGKVWFETRFLPKFHPVTIFALLLALVLIFAFQAENLITRWLAVLLLAVPIVIQVYFNSTLAYLLMRKLRVPHNVASPGALIGASNFFELAVAVAITLFGAGSGAALATVVGVLVEVPVMLSVCKICNQSRGWYQAKLFRNPYHELTQMNTHSKPTILILCTGNSCRSHIGEGFLRAALGELANVQSAGSKPAGYVHPLAIKVMAEVGIDISAHRSKHLKEFLEQPVNTVITVCGNADQACPIFPGQLNRHHWPFFDPAKATGSEEEILNCFRTVRDEMRRVFEAYTAGLKDALKQS